MDGQIKIGCCGFQVARSTYYRKFSLVEAQQTFYDPPAPDTLKRWRDEAPADFEFTMKAWQLVTHESWSRTYGRLRRPLTAEQRAEIGSFRWTQTVRWAWDITFQAARLLAAEKVLFQCPAGFRPTAENKDRLRNFFHSIDRSGLVCIWEPRGQWEAPEIAELCRELDLVHCVDPFLADAVTPGLRYLRLHGFAGYRHQYTDLELLELAGKRAEGAETYFMFNNVHMIPDAIRFRDLLRATVEQEQKG